MKNFTDSALAQSLQKLADTCFDEYKEKASRHVESISTLTYDKAFSLREAISIAYQNIPSVYNGVIPFRVGARKLVIESDDHDLANAIENYVYNELKSRLIEEYNDCERIVGDHVKVWIFDNHDFSDTFKNLPFPAILEIRDGAWRWAMEQSEELGFYALGNTVDNFLAKYDEALELCELSAIAVLDAQKCCRKEEA